MSLLKTTYLGAIRGRSDGDVIEYLGIRYATLSNRLAGAVLITDLEGDELDATREGPTAISPQQGCDLEYSIMQKDLPKGDLPQSGTKCLNLNVTVPAGVDSTSKLPVFVFIHGGGFNIGANSWPQFNFARFVKLSARLGLPVVAVTINYRLGPFGFLTSDELREAGYKANNGLHDQRVALEWIWRHIADFGGDPDNVTLSGMSAGAASVLYHLSSDHVLFKRAIVMSGSHFLIQPLPLDLHEANYNRAMVALGLSGASAEERIRALLETPGHELLSRLPPSVISVPAVDSDFVSEPPTFAKVMDPNVDVPRGREWCKELMIGDAQMDGNIFRVMMPGAEERCAERFIKILNTTLSSKPKIAEDILRRYGISTDIPDEQAFSSILDYFNDIAFFAPTLATAAGWKSHAWVYYFNQGNSWEGPSKGRAGHLLDVVYLFQNFQDFLTPDEQALATRFAGDIFKFCYSKSAWPAVDWRDLHRGFAARVYGSREVAKSEAIDILSPFHDESDRRKFLFDYRGEVSLDELIQVFYRFRGF
ncbi:hypothetical protein BDW75DRAFT_247123 [Aspergillus navahoensis]